MLTEVRDREDSLEYDLRRVSGAILLADGSLVVAAGAAGVIRLYAPDGGFVRTLLGEGAGPGEVRSPGPLWHLGGDTLEIFDYSLRRVTRFTGNGMVVHLYSLDELPSSIYAMGRLPGGGLAGQGTHYPQDGRTSGPVERLPLFVIHIGERGTDSDTLLRIPGPEAYPRQGREGPVAFPTWHHVGFGRETTIRTNSIGLWVGRATTFEIEHHRGDGSLSGLIRLTLPPTMVGDEDRIADQEREFANIDDWATGSEQLKDQQRERIAAIRYAEEFPPYEQFFVGPAGELWVEGYRRPADPFRQYLIFDPDGLLTGKARLPARSKILSVGNGHIVTRHVDDDGLEYVRAYCVDFGH